VIKPRRITLAEHVAFMTQRRGSHRMLVEKPEGKNRLTVLDIDRRIIINRVLNI
jgi:hypothetical protein